MTNEESQLCIWPSLASNSLGWFDATAKSSDGISLPEPSTSFWGQSWQMLPGKKKMASDPWITLKGLLSYLKFSSSNYCCFCISPVPLETWSFQFSFSNCSRNAALSWSPILYSNFLIFNYNSLGFRVLFEHEKPLDEDDCTLHRELEFHWVHFMLGMSKRSTDIRKLKGWTIVDTVDCLLRIYPLLLSS